MLTATKPTTGRSKEILDLLAKNLKSELEDRGLALSKLPEEVRKATTEILSSRPDKFSLKSLGIVCNFLGVTPFTLFSRPRTKLFARGVDSSYCKAASILREIFLAITPQLKSFRTQIFLHRPEGRSPEEIIKQTATNANKIRKNGLENIFDVYECWNIPVFIFREKYFRTGRKLRALLCVEDDKVAVFVKDDIASSSSIAFTLAHELYHLLHDAYRDKDKRSYIDVEVNVGLFPKHLSPHEVPDYAANKFAEFFLVPIEVAQILYKSVTNCDWAWFRDVVQNHILPYVSMDVILNAICDYAWYLERKKLDINLFQEWLEANYTPDYTLADEFLKKQNSLLNEIISSREGEEFRSFVQTVKKILVL